MTVTGPVDPAVLGVTAPHEHLFTDMARPLEEHPRTAEEQSLWEAPLSQHNRGRVLYNILTANRDSMILDDVADTISEVRDFRASGGGTIVDLTTVGLGRRARDIRKVSRETNVKVVLGTGWYREAFHPADLASRSVDELAAIMVRDIVEGIDGTGIHAGIIGEVPTERLDGEGAETSEHKVLRAAARASVRTGAGIVLHNSPVNRSNWHRALDILKDEGADLRRVVAGHANGADVATLEALMARGVFVSIDNLGAPFIASAPFMDVRPNLVVIRELIRRGHADQLLLSQDVCTKLQQHKHGGAGYDFILTTVVPWLRSQGVSEEDIRRITVDNPARLLTFAAPRV